MDSKGTDCEIYEAVFVMDIHQLRLALFATGKWRWDWKKIVLRDVDISMKMW